MESNATVWEPGKQPLPAPARANQVAVHPPSACDAMPTINPFR
jgi:hypothetical protein